MALSDNLISYWSLEEASGNRVDAHTGGNDLTSNNTVGQNTGKVGSCAQFNAASSRYLSRADNASLSTGDIDFTVAFWAYFDTLAATQIMVAKYLPSANQEYRVDFASATSRFRFLVSNDGAANIPIAADNLGAPSTATWYFIICWHNAAANTINIQVNNGTPNSAAHTTGVFDGTGAFTIGASAAPATFTDGRIDELGFWKRVLTADERTALYNGGNGMSYADITAAPGQPTAMRRRGSTEPTGARRIGRGW